MQGTNPEVPSHLCVFLAYFSIQHLCFCCCFNQIPVSEMGNNRSVAGKQKMDAHLGCLSLASSFLRKFLLHGQTHNLWMRNNKQLQIFKVPVFAYPSTPQTRAEFQIQSIWNTGNRTLGTP